VKKKLSDLNRLIGMVKRRKCLMTGDRYNRKNGFCVVIIRTVGLLIFMAWDR